MTNKEDIIKEAISSAPPISVAGLSLVGVSLQDWVLIATLFWLTCQIGYFAYQRYKEWKNVSNGETPR